MALRHCSPDNAQLCVEEHGWPGAVFFAYARHVRSTSSQPSPVAQSLLRRQRAPAAPCVRHAPR
jgi:hypothetical protein